MKTFIILLMLITFSIYITGLGIQAINNAEGLTVEQARYLDTY